MGYSAGTHCFPTAYMPAEGPLRPAAKVIRSKSRSPHPEPGRSPVSGMLWLALTHRA